MNIVEMSTIPTEQLLAELQRRQVDVGELLKRIPIEWMWAEQARRGQEWGRQRLIEQDRSEPVQEARQRLHRLKTGGYQEQARQDAMNSGRLQPEGTPPPVQLPTQEEIRQGALEKTRYAFPGLT